MKRKIFYMSLGAAFTLIVSFSLISLADGTTKKSTSPSTSQASVDTVTGQVSFLDLHNGKLVVMDGQKKYEFVIDSQTVIMKNNKNATLQELQLGDPIKVILNSSGAVRYIVINLGQQAAQPITPYQVQIRSIPAETSQTASSNQLQAQEKPNKPVIEKVPVEEIEQDFEQEDHGKHKGWLKEKHKKHHDEHEKEDKNENEDD